MLLSTFLEALAGRIELVYLFISLRPLAALTQLAPQVFVAGVVTRSPHYAHLGHCLPAYSSYLPRFCGKIGDTTQSSCQLVDNSEELSGLLLLDNGDITRSNIKSSQRSTSPKRFYFVASPSMIP